MADDHASVLEFENEYNQQVLFIVGSMESLLDSQDLDRDESSPSSTSSPARKLRKQSRIEVHPHDEEEGVSQNTEEKENTTPLAATNKILHTPSSQPFSKETIMKKYEESEKMFQEEILGKKPIKKRQPPMIKSKTQPCAPVSHQVSKTAMSSPSAGMEHLDLLVKLMEQLSHLKEENCQLRHKNTYLNDTQSLLRMQNRMLLSSGLAGKELARWKVKSHLQSSKGSVRKKKLEESLDETDSSDMDDLPESRKKPKLHHRSQSVGSIQIERIDLELGSVADKDVKSPEKAKDGGRFEMFSKSKITSKWERVKKVFSGKPEQGSKVEHSTITAEQLVRANSKHSMTVLTSSQQLQPLPTIPTSKSCDYGMSGLRPDSPEKADHRLLRPTLSAGDYPPPSPTSIQSEPMIPSVVTNDGIYEEVDLPVTSASGGLASLAPPEPDYHGSSGISSLAGEEGEVRVTASKDYSSGDEPRSPQFLTVQDSQKMRRRQSSPALSLCDESEFQNMDLDAKGSSKLGRSHSFKTSKSDLEGMANEGSESYNSIRRKNKCKSSKTAWGRVKDIIHTRKDSLKRKNKRSNSAGDSLPDGSTSDGEFFCFRYDYEDIEQWERETGGSPKLVRKGSLRGGDSSSPKTPTPGERDPRYKSPSDSPPTSKKELFQGAASAPSSPPQHVELAVLMGSVSDDFNKKIQEWEDKKRKSIYRENSCMDDEDSQRAKAAKFTDDFIRKMEEWERIKGLSSRKSRGSGKLSQSPVGANSPEEQLEPPSVEDLQKHLSQSFSKTVKEWQKIKESRIKDSGSPVPDSGPRGIHRSRKQDRSKSRERDRSRSKYERQREKELQKIEKKEQKIEKEKEKLEMMKKKLEDLETMSEAEVRGLTKEFARKLHEWEVMKGMKLKEPGEEGTTVLITQPSSSNLLAQQSRFGVHVRSNSAKEHRETMGKGEQMKADSLKRERAQSEYGRRERTHSEGKNNTSSSSSAQLGQETLTASTDSKLTERSQRSSSVPLLTQTSNLVDDSTSIDLNLTSETVYTLEETNRRLIEDLQEKEEDLLLLQDEIQQLTERINMMNKEQSRQIELYKRELWASSRLGRHTIENDLVSASIRELGDTVDQINRQQSQVLAEKDKLKVQLEEEIAARHVAERQVIERLQQIRKNSNTGQPEGLDKFCQFFKKLQDQLAELKLGVTERNQLVYKLHHQLVTQEVQNRLLQTDLQRTHQQVDFLQDAKAKGTLRRVKTFGGTDYITRGEVAVKCKHRLSGRMSRHKKPIVLSRDLLQDLHHALHLSMQPEWDWLYRLQQYNKLLQGAMCVENEEVQTEHHGADVSVQTVMTLCKVPYNVPQPQLPQLTAAPTITRQTLTNLGSVTGITTTTVNVLSTKAAQTQTDSLAVLSSLQSHVTSSSNVNQCIDSYVSSSTTKVSTSTITISSKASNSASPQVVNRSPMMVGVHHRQQPQTERPMTPSSPTPKSPRSPHVLRVLQSSQTLQNSQQFRPVGGKAPPKPPRRRMVPRVDPTTNSTGSSSITTDSIVSSPKPTKVTETRTLDNEDMTLTFSVQKVQHSNNVKPSESDQQKTIVQTCAASTQGSPDTDDVFSDNKSSQQPPYSPIIRSRYPRKLRSEAKVLATENRAWKATPPRRIIRHRKSSTERKPEETSPIPEDIMTRSQEQPLDVPNTVAQSSRSLPCDLRQLNPTSPETPRVYSDSLAPPVEHYMNNDYLRGRYRFRYQREMQRLPVQDMISRFETVSKAPLTTSPSPPIPDMDGRKSPIQRPIQSPIHKLKTAQELLIEHEARWNSLGHRHRSSSANRAEHLSADNQGRTKISSTSSDKENETSIMECPEHSPVIRVPKGEGIKHLVQRLSSPPRETTLKPPLKDVTNGGKVKSIKEALTEQSTVQRGEKQQLEPPQDGLMLKRSEILRERSMSPVTPKLRHMVHSDPGVTLKTDKEGPWEPVAAASAAPSTMSSSYPPSTSCTMTPPSSPSSHTSGMEKRFQRLFGKKMHISSSSPTSSMHSLQQSPAAASTSSSAPSVVPASPKTGAISMLCKQALVVNLEQVDLPPDPEDLDGKKSSKNWLQKPRKFFKVSK